MQPFEFNPNFWTEKYTVTDNATASGAVADVFNDDSGAFQYYVGCTYGAGLLMLGGLLRAHYVYPGPITNRSIQEQGEAAFYQGYFDSICGNDPLQQADSDAVKAGTSSLVARHDKVPWNDWIPGDWAWAMNRDKWSGGDVPNGPKTNGREGSNFYYLGQGVFQGYSRNSREHRSNLDGVLQYVWSWRYENDVLEKYQKLTGSPRPKIKAPTDMMKKDPGADLEGSLREVRDFPRLSE